MNRKRQIRIFSRLLSAILLASLVFSMLPYDRGRAEGTEILVTTTADGLSTDGYCSLREAIIAANKNLATSPNAGECPAGSASGTDTITLPAGEFLLTRTDNGKEDASSTGDLDITGSVSIQGAGADLTRIVGVNFTDRIFHIFSGPVSITGVTIEGGKVALDGGAVWNAASLTLENVVIASNSSKGKGGAIYNKAALSIKNSTIANNTATGNGAVFLDIGTNLRMANSTISGNAAVQGGAIYQNGGTASLNNVTIAYNTATGSRTVKSNLTGGVYVASGAFYVSNTILAENGKDCYGTLTSRGYNLTTSSCAFAGSGPNYQVPSADLGLDSQLLRNAPGDTLTHALLPGSAAIDKGSSAEPGPMTEGACEATDQRGVERPQGQACDIGAYEYISPESPAQKGPIFIVNTTADDDGICKVDFCTLRQAIHAANSYIKDSQQVQIHFNIPTTGETPEINPSDWLPAIVKPIIVDGRTQPGAMKVIVNGLGAGDGVDGLVLDTDGAAIYGLEIRQFRGNGVVVKPGKFGNTIQETTFDDNGKLGIDLYEDSVNPEALDAANAPVILGAVPEVNAGKDYILGRLTGTAGATYQVDIFANETCDPSGYGEGQALIASFTVEMKSQKDVDKPFVYFWRLIDKSFVNNDFITATATGPDGTTSEFSHCLAAGPRNYAWPWALEVDSGFPEEQYLDRLGMSRWYKIAVAPNSKVKVYLEDLPENYDLTLYKDIQAAYEAMTEVDEVNDLERLGAEFAPDAFTPDMFAPDAFTPDAFTPDAFTPDAFTPDAFTPDAFTPDAFTPDAFTPDAFTPDAFTPDAFTPDAFTPDAFTPDAFTPDAFTPDAFTPDAFTPDAFTPDAFTPDAFTSAQQTSLVGASGFAGTASEFIAVNTWNNTGYFYVRVRGRSGAYNFNAPFKLMVEMLPSECSSLTSSFGEPASYSGTAGVDTLILTDLDRFEAGEDTASLQGKINLFLQSLANQGHNGELVDVSSYPRVAAANAQADNTQFVNCPYAKNLVAMEIKAIVDSYPDLEYIVILGDDSVIPFFRHPDQSNLANESMYKPPVKPETPSDASLKGGYVLGQDFYGAKIELSSKISTLPLPDIAVGRLVSTVGEINNMLQAYIDAGGVITPANALVTGYDFLVDSSNEVLLNLENSLGQQPEYLISDIGDIPWTAQELSGAWLADGKRHDIVYLAGHFSASSALAADFTTRLVTQHVLDSNADLYNALIFSAGCHSGYNIVPEDAIYESDGFYYYFTDSNGVQQRIKVATRLPDWARAFATKGATFIGGTGYQYGDTEFIEYSELIYLNFSKQIGMGLDPVPVGKALVRAKTDYMAATPVLNGISQKALIESTLFGLPMMKVNMPNKDTSGPGPSEIGGVSEFEDRLGLAYQDFSVNPPLEGPITFNMYNVADQSAIAAQYFKGKDGVVANPEEVVIPLDIRNVSFPNKALRGAVFLGGTYFDWDNIFPLTGGTSFDYQGTHTYFRSDVFFPAQPWRINYFDALQQSGSGNTFLMLNPAQYKSGAPGADTGIMRTYSNMNFRLYYSGYTGPWEEEDDYQAALAAAPSINKVLSMVDGNMVYFKVYVTGHPYAGIKEVFITYTNEGSGQWMSIPLNRQTGTLWTGSLDITGMDPAKISYFVQAVNGVGLVALDTNRGEYYVPGEVEKQYIETMLAFQGIVPENGRYGDKILLSAKLTAKTNGEMYEPLSGMSVFFGIGSQSLKAVTGADGVASINLPLSAYPADGYKLRASFGGFQAYLPSKDEWTFDVLKQDTTLTLKPIEPSQYSDPMGFVADLVAANGTRLAGKNIFFMLEKDGVEYPLDVLATDYTGRAYLQDVNVPPGVYVVTACFNPDNSDPVYNPSCATSEGAFNIVVDPEQVTMQYTGDLFVPVGMPINLSVLVSDDDGYPADLTKGKVKYLLKNDIGETIFESLVDVTSNGTASAQVPAQPIGVYDLFVSLENEYFTADPLNVLIVVYDPNAGRQVNGNAQLDVTDNGRLSFAFVVSNSGKGKLKPGGQLHFNFRDTGDILRATSIDFIAFNGDRADFQGSGTINGMGDYGFYVSVIDRDLVSPSQPRDLVRIVIWEKAVNKGVGTIIFDTQWGVEFTAPPTTELSSGNITIHY